MAEEKDLELDDEATEGGGKSKKKLIIILVTVLLIVGIGAGAAFFLLSGDDAEEKAQNSEQQSKASDSEKAEKEESPEEPKEAHYVSLNPAFVISFQMGNRARFLQFKLELLTYKKSVADALADNMPMIRNEVVMLVGRQDLAELRTKDGREKLQQTLKEALNQALKRDADKEGIEAVLFTDYVMQ